MMTQSDSAANGKEEAHNALKSVEEFEVVPEAESVDSPAATEKFKKLKNNFEKCEAERKEYLDGWQRAKADSLNYKKDEARRMEDLAKFVTASLSQDLLTVLDSFELALSHGLPPEVERGVMLIRSQLEDTLRKRGLEGIVVESGDEFNPEKHESIGEMESDKAVGTVAEVVQKGYVFQGRVLRPARVRIAK